MNVCVCEYDANICARVSVSVYVYEYGSANMCERV